MTNFIRGRETFRNFCFSRIGTSSLAFARHLIYALRPLSKMYSFRKTVLIVCVSRRGFFKLLSEKRTLGLFSASFSTCSRLCRKQFKPLSSFFNPAPVRVPLNEAYAGEELSGEVTKIQVIRTLNMFFNAPELKSLVEENGLDDAIFRKGAVSFRKFCILNKQLPTELHVTFYDVIKGSKNPLNLFPYFLSHVREIFPHLEYMEDLKKIGDLRFPANWYPEARNMKRKVYFHCGPTNSGKTHHAIKKFLCAKSGIYCGPLKLLAVEVFQKANEKQTPCDLITGEEITHAHPDGDCSNHISCTVEMCSLEKTFDIAIIDEIQMIKDPSRGWAWTRALLGVQAKEIYVCGEEAAVDLIQSILSTTNEELEVKKYNRLTKLTVTEPMKDLKNAEPGDCIVCFNKKDIYSVTLYLERLGQEVAVIYGSLPPGTKTSQCAKFNDPNDPCKIMVATDAIGMGLNLSIRRIIFFSITKPSVNENGDIENVPISVSQALQIAGRAGRYGSRYSEGLVTTFHSKDLNILSNLLSQPPEPVVSAGLLPTLEQIEMYSYYLPHSKLSDLIDIFITLSTVDDSTYFMCDQKVFKSLAQMIEHFNLPLTVKYVFCSAPIDIKVKFLCVLFLKFAKMFSENRTVSFGWLAKEISWPPNTPKDLKQLQKLEEIHDAMDLYLWLSYRFPEYFPDGEAVKQMQKTVDQKIQEGVGKIAPLLSAPLEEESDSLCPEDEELVPKTNEKKMMRQIFLGSNHGKTLEKSRTKAGTRRKNALNFFDHI